MRAAPETSLRDGLKLSKNSTPDSSRRAGSECIDRRAGGPGKRGAEAKAALSLSLPTRESLPERICFLVSRRALPLLALLAACGSNEHLVQPTPEIARRPSSAFVEGPPAVAALQERLAREGSVILRSWKGRWIGTDVDTDFQLLRDGRVKIVDYDEDVDTHHARCRLTPEGLLRIEGWPDLALGADGKDLQLRPLGPASSKGEGYWPFRSIPLNQKSRFHD